jgi:hemolysin III
MHTGERFNSYSHLAGLVLALAGSGLLLEQTRAGGDPARSSMLALYGASALFHGSRGAAKQFWQRADHCAIYLQIAGTYTPLALVTLEGVVGWGLLGLVWSMAVFGIARELRAREGQLPALGIYLGMGWLGLLIAVPLVSRMEARGLAWLLGGAALYTAGTVFYRNPTGLRHAHGTWHLFVLGGTASHFVAVAGFVL